MTYRGVSAVEVFYPCSDVKNLEYGVSEVFLEGKRIRSYELNSLRDLPLGRGNEVLQVTVVFPREDKPDHLPRNVFDKPFERGDVFVRKLDKELRFSESQLGEHSVPNIKVMVKD